MMARVRLAGSRGCTNHDEIRDTRRGIRHVDLRNRRVRQALVQHIVNDANDLERFVPDRERRRLQARQPDDLAERRTSVEAGRHEAAVDDRDRLSGVQLAVRQEPTRLESNVQRARIGTADLVHFYRLGARRRAHDVGGSPHVAERMEPGIQSHRGDARQSAHAIEQLAKEGNLPCGLRIAAGRERHAQREQSVG